MTRIMFLLIVHSVQMLKICVPKIKQKRKKKLESTKEIKQH